MGHSHIPISHLVKQVELYRLQRSRRDLRPPTITEFINRVAELFDPTSEAARVGFDCRWDEERWNISMYLGSMEVVGGRHDGDRRHPGFEFDARRLLELFGRVERLVWSARPDGCEEADLPPCSVLTLDGIRDDISIRLQIVSVSPATTHPGLRQFADGRHDPV